MNNPMEMNNPMAMAQWMGNINKRLSKLGKPGENTMNVLDRVIEYYEQHGPKPEPATAAPVATVPPVPPSPVAAPAPPAQAAPVAAETAPAPTQAPAPPRYRFKDGPKMQTTMVSAFGGQWHLKVGLNPVDLMPLIGSTPDDPVMQAAMHKTFIAGPNGTGEIRHERKRMPIAQPMIEPIDTAK